MSGKRILNLLRATFVALSLLAGATSLVWHLRPEWVETLDANLVKVHQHFPRKDYLKGRDAVSAGDVERGLALLESAERRMQDVKPGDRLAQTRVQTLDLLAQTLIKQGRAEEALAWSDRLHEFDERDLVNDMRRADLLGELGRLDDARVILERAASVGPRAPFVLGAWQRYALRRGDAELAARTTIQLLQDDAVGSLATGWQFFASSATSGGMVESDLEFVGDPGGETRRASAPIVETARPLRRLRLDLPTRTRLGLTDLRVTIGLAGGDMLELDADDVGRCSGVERRGAWFESTGISDPFIYFELPVDGIDAVRVDFSLRLGLVLDEDLDALLETFDLEGRRAALVAEFGDEAVRRLEGAIAR